MPEDKQLHHRGMPAQRKRVLTALIGSSVLFLSSQYMFWRTFNPFQSRIDAGIDEFEFERKMELLMQEEEGRREAAPPTPVSHSIADNKVADNQVTNHSNPNDGIPHHTDIPSDHDNKPFCLQWGTKDAYNRTLQPFDNWWVHHPTWVISKETDDMFCVEPGKDTALMQTFKRFYHTQFETGCDKIHWRVMWSSGWGADMMNVQVSFCDLLRIVFSSPKTKGIHCLLHGAVWSGRVRYESAHPTSYGIVESRRRSS